MPPLDPLAAPLPSKSHAEHPPVDPSVGTALPPGHPHRDPEQALEAATPGEIAFDEKTVIAGQLKVSAKLKENVKAGDVIYLVARRLGEGGAAGPVMAVRRLEAGVFPMKFQLDSRDAMMTGTKMEGPLLLTGRVDKDGDAMTKNPGDVTGTLTLKTLPAPKAALVLDTVL